MVLNCGSFGENRSGSIELEGRLKAMQEEKAEAELQKIRLFLEKLEQEIHECRHFLKGQSKEA